MNADNSNNNNNNNEEERQRSNLLIPWMKVSIVLLLVFLSFLLQVTVWSLELHLAHRRQSHPASTDSATIPNDDPPITVQTSRGPNEDELYTLQMQQAHRTNNKPASAYWKQVVDSGLIDWDRDFDTGASTHSDWSLSSSKNATKGIVALEWAAQKGHSSAQTLYANALSAGFFLTHHQPLNSTLHVSDDWTSSQTSQQQHTKALLYWRMAAMAGDVDALTTVADRLDDTTTTCHDKLPYYSSAAHLLMDQLLTNKQSRGRVLPSRDRHVLYKIHLHGGSGLEHDQRPDESVETLQFYHVRATTISGHSVEDNATAAAAAYTLGRYYSNGVRGVAQNLTKALYYYEVAAQTRHWEAAGQAGMLHLWGIGTSQNAHAARKWFKLGTPDGITGCQSRYQEKLQQRKGSDKIFLCDNVALNGMGLLHLLGVPMVYEVDRNLAQEYFTLARDQGNPDAAYNLAMMKLGWKTHFVELQDNGQTITEPFPIVDGATSPTATEYQQMILPDLTTAASKGHAMARHRLGLIYEHGIAINRAPTNPRIAKTVQQVVKPDCSKAIQHYTWITENANFQRSRRLRNAYKYYVAGQWDRSLMNYLAVAETGNDLAQLNAAFLLEQGECLGMSKSDCAKASVRLWKKAAEKGSAEASLRVGDFYYYGRFRKDKPFGPFAWLQYLLYPEEHVLPQVLLLIETKLPFLFTVLQEVFGVEPSLETTASESDATCNAVDAPGSCLPTDHFVDQEHTLNGDLASAAHYYRLAAERNQNPRAHFNLGFMYQWGLGLKQDFPLAKRQYDLSVTTSGATQEANIPVSMALFALCTHEWFMKLRMSWTDQSKESTETISARKQLLAGKTKTDVILGHIFSWESVLILLLTLVLTKLLAFQRTRR